LGGISKNDLIFTIEYLDQ